MDFQLTLTYYSYNAYTIPNDAPSMCGHKHFMACAWKSIYDYILISLIIPNIVGKKNRENKTAAFHPAQQKRERERGDNRRWSKMLPQRKG